MLTDEQIAADLASLKEIVAAHKAPDAELAVHQEMVLGQELTVFSKIPTNLGQLYERALNTPDLDFLVYQDERFTFAETLDMAKRFGRVLIEKYNIQRGERVAICARNSPEWCIAYMGITLTGAIAVPMNSWWKGPEIEYGLRDSGSKLLLADPARHEQISPWLEQLGVELIAIKPEATIAGIPEFYALLESTTPLTAEEIAGFAVGADDDASIMYTSGSTGEPKGVLASHRGILSALFTWKFVKEINEELRPELKETDPNFKEAILANVPLFHVTGSHAQFLACFIYQRKFVMMYKWDAGKALELIEKEKISVFHGVPTMAWELMHEEKFAETDLSSLRAVQSGGAPRPPEHLKMMLQKFPKRALPGLGYGLTETNAIGAIITGLFYEARPNSTGRPSPPVTEVRIVDEAGHVLGANEVGEICIRGPSIMKGYWNKPEETAAVLKDGWFHTGDVGYLDSLGFLIISDRAKDIVIRGGENIGCAEVEYAISEHPAINEVSVYGIPDERLGEIPAATVMLKSGQSLDQASLQEFLKDKVAAFKIPEVISFRHEQLPRLGTGKIAKKILRQETMDSLA
jgi:acyl-CoA synthetase (AMP-forming)/AMP-acid ligase II